MATEHAADLTFRFHPVSPDRQDAAPRDSGIETSLATLENADGERVAYLRVSFTTEQIQQRWPTALHWKATVANWWWKDDAPTDSELWETAARHKAIERLPPAWKHTPTVPDADTVAVDLAAAAATFEAERRMWVDCFLVPFVAYAHVDDGYRRRGLGTRLYLETARELAATGRILRASGIQTGDAKALWGTLEQAGQCTTVTTTFYDFTRTVLALDLRATEADQCTESAA